MRASYLKMLSDRVSPPHRRADKAEAEAEQGDCFRFGDNHHARSVTIKWVHAPGLWRLGPEPERSRSPRPRPSGSRLKNYGSRERDALRTPNATRSDARREAIKKQPHQRSARDRDRRFQIEIFSRIRHESAWKRDTKCRVFCVKAELVIIIAIAKVPDGKR